MEPRLSDSMGDGNEMPPLTAADVLGDALKFCSRLWENSLFSPAHDSTEQSGPEQVQPAWTALFSFQNTCSEMANQLGADSSGSAIDLFRKTAEATMAGYKEEWLKLLNIPAVGITRFYQERMNRALETYSLFQSSLSEFIELLTSPMEKTAMVLREEMERGGQNGANGVHDHQTLYRLWIKTLESYYLTLLRSEQYTNTLVKTLSALFEYREAKKKFLLDLLRDWPIATTQDVDEISRELYLLKKRVRELESKKKRRAT